MAGLGLSGRDLALGCAVTTLLTVIVTWPQAIHMTTGVAEHQDSLFSMWRLSWIAHALRTSPGHLFDANIFHPTTRTLAYSDAMLLEGLLGAPLLWLGLSPVTTYNTLLLGGIAASGVGMFVLARYLTGDTGAALVSAAVFTMAPYRIDHFMHLELQWAMWTPLAFWALHRAIDRASWRAGALAGVFLWLQALSSVYYGVFLGLAAVALTIALLATMPRQAAPALPGLVLGALVAAVLTIPYAVPYVENARVLGERGLAEVVRYSAKPSSYLASPPQNWLWGWTGTWADSERQLFPGMAAVALAVAGIFSSSRRLALVYAGLALVFVEMSFGANGRAYSWLLPRVSLLQGLRAPARFSIMVYCALAVSAGFGARALVQGRPRKIQRLGTLALLLIVIVEFANRGMTLADQPNMGRATLYHAMRALGPGVVIELPVPSPSELPGADPTYQFWSSAHWYPLVNGYSGYYPVSYLRTLHAMRTFPDDESVARLGRLNVRYIVVHRAFIEDPEYVSLVERVQGRKEVKFVGTFADPIGQASLFVLEPPK